MAHTLVGDRSERSSSKKPTARRNAPAPISRRQAGLARNALIVIFACLFVPFAVEWASFAAFGRWVAEPDGADTAARIVYMAHTTSATLVVILWSLQCAIGIGMLTGRRPRARRAHRRLGYVAAASTLVLCAIAFANVRDILIEDVAHHFNDMDVSGVSMTAIFGTGFLLIGIRRARQRNYALHLDDIVFGLAIYSSTGTLRLIDYGLFPLVPEIADMPETDPIRAIPVVGSGVISAVIWLGYAWRRQIVLAQWGKLVTIAVILAVFAGLYGFHLAIA